MVTLINTAPSIPALPKVEDKKKINLRYMLIAPFAATHIFWDAKTNEMRYEVEEPLLQPEEQEALHRLEQAMLELININVATEQTVESAAAYIDKTARLLIEELNMKISAITYQKLFYYLFRDFIGMNEIDPLLKDYFIEDIECNGINTPIYVIHRIYRNLRTNISFKDIDTAASFVEKLAQRTGRYISYAQPLLDGSLPDGSRVNATYTKDVTARGPTFCFKDGNIQLNDGRLKNIKNLFEESKKNFGFSIEDGNEIISPINLHCCGVEEKDLQQKDSLVKSIIKLKAPHKLAKIELEDGGIIEVTLDHLFHVADDSLQLVEAQNIKKGMLIPMPKKINVSGYRQKIDVYTILKDFSYTKRISVISSPEIKEIVSQVISSHDNNGKYRQVLSEKYHVGQSYFYEIINRGSSLSLGILDQICEERGIVLSDFKNIAINVYGGGSKNQSKTIKIPADVSEELAYLAGALISDGHLSKNYVDFSCYEEEFRDSVKDKLLRIFGNCDSYYDDTRVYLCNVFAPFFFNRIFEIPLGKKSYIVKVPDVIFKSDNKVIAMFLRGLFDGDGTSSAGLSYKSYSKELVEGITYLLARLGIYCYLRNQGKEYRINIPSPYYKIYMEVVGFDSLTKRQKLQGLIHKQVDYKMNMRHDRIPGAPLLSIIKKLGIQKKSILENCSVTFNRIYYSTFSRSFASTLLKEVLKHKDADRVKEEIEYVQWLLDSNQEFVRVKNVEIANNTEPVYDITLEPCKFFVAGNKPMNIFDTIRKFTQIPWTPTQLISFNTVSPEMLAYFWILLQYKASILIVGGTASGKTTFLNALAFFIPPEARVVSIEDTREINIPRENWLPAVARPSIGIGRVGEVDLFDILKSSFRQNPDYLIVGEVRGKEAAVLFQGMASGHSSLSTMHADSVDTLIQRLQTPPIELSPSLINALDCVAIATHATVQKHETRRIREVVEIVHVQRDGSAVINTPLYWDPAQDTFFFKKQSKVFEKISVRQGIPLEKIYYDFAIRARLLYVLYQKKVFGFQDIQNVINDYFKNPLEVIQKYNLVPPEQQALVKGI